MKQLLTFCLFLTFFSCKKEAACEKWEVQDYFIPRQPGTVDYHDPFVDPKVCGDELKAAHRGEEWVMQDDAQGVSKRKYLQKLP